MMDMTTPMKPKPLVNATCKLGKKGCFADGRCHALGDCENKIVTNADKIRAMTDEELIAFFVLEDKCQPERFSSRKCDGFDSCKDCWIDWLKQPAEDDC